MYIGNAHGDCFGARRSPRDNPSPHKDGDEETLQEGKARNDAHAEWTETKQQKGMGSP